MSTPQHVVVVGAGLAGLSAALHLRGAGLEVTVVERLPGPGGRAAPTVRTTRDGRTFVLDTGPVVLTMPETLREAFAAVGADLSDHITLRDVDPAYHVQFPDGSALDLTTDAERMATRIEGFAGRDEAAGYLRWRAHVTRLHDVQYRAFIDRNHDSPVTLLGPDLARLVALGGFGRLDVAVGRFFRDPRLQRAFSFQSLYAGVAPQRARALYAVIAYMDLVAGVSYPVGGMGAVATGLAAAASEAGVRFVFGTTAEAVERTGTAVVGVRLGSGAASGGAADNRPASDRTGELLRADAVVLTCELPTVASLLGRSRVGRSVEHSPSCVLLAAGASVRWPAPEHHHSMVFGGAWAGVFEDLRRGRPMRDPSFLLSVPSRTSPGMAPRSAEGTPTGHSVHLLFPAPNLTAGPDRETWGRVRGAYRDHMLSAVARAGYPGLGEAIEVEELFTPADWADAGMAAGTPFAAAHTFAQTGPFRTPNVVAPGVVLAGTNTLPGVGVPMVLVSGRLAAERLLGSSASGAARVH